MKLTRLTLTFSLVLALMGCVATSIEGECTYIREIRSTYVCEEGSKLEQFKIQTID